MIFFFKYFAILEIFLPSKICHLSLFFRLAHWFTKLSLFKLSFLNPFSMYTAGKKLSFSKINTEIFILILQCGKPLYTPNFKLGNVTKVFFGIHSQIVPLKLSFAFWVLPCKHFSNSVSLLSSKSICRPYFINNVFWKTWPRCISLGVYKLALPVLYLHQLSEPMGQNG